MHIFLLEWVRCYKWLVRHSKNRGKKEIVGGGINLNCIIDNWINLRRGRARAIYCFPIAGHTRLLCQAQSFHLLRILSPNKHIALCACVTIEIQERDRAIDQAVVIGIVVKLNSWFRNIFRQCEQIVATTADMRRCRQWLWAPQLRRGTSSSGWFIKNGLQ